MNVRALFSLFLVAILVACPSMCRASEVACCSEHEAEGCQDEPRQEFPESSQDVDSCICSGTAIKADGSHAVYAASPFDSPPLASLDESVRILSVIVARGGQPADPDDWLEPLRLHARLQVFLC